jgi:molecular chaperone HscB
VQLAREPIPCPRCGARLETPLACGGCGALLEPGAEPSPFDALGLEPAWALDRGALRRHLLRLSRLVHPDFFGAAEAGQRELAERNSARLNRGFEVLADDLARADWLIVARGGPAEGALRDMPQTFLLEVLEWNEALEEAREAPAGSAPRERLDGLATELAAARDEALERLGALLEPLPEPGAPALADARRELNALRYLRRTLDQIEALRLEQASSR